jgi:hypothetical protein
MYGHWQDARYVYIAMDFIQVRVTSHGLGYFPWSWLLPMVLVLVTSHGLGLGYFPWSWLLPMTRTESVTDVPLYVSIHSIVAVNSGAAGG